MCPFLVCRPFVERNAGAAERQHEWQLSVEAWNSKEIALKSKINPGFGVEVSGIIPFAPFGRANGRRIERPV
jgi:hypothetical protein